MANISTLGYVHSEKLVMWLTLFIIMQAVAAIVGMVSGYMDYSWLQAYSNGVFTSEEVAKSSAEFNDLFKVLIFWVQATIYIITAVLILMWIYRANYNVHELGATNMTFNPVMSVVWFFVPVMGLWKPYQAMLQLWMASHEPVNWKSAKSHPVVLTWWLLWLATIAIGFVSLEMAQRAVDNSTASQASMVEMLSDFVTLLSTLAMLMLVRHIHQAQLAIVEEG